MSDEDEAGYARCLKSVSSLDCLYARDAAGVGSDVFMGSLRAGSSSPAEHEVASNTWS